jgi:hypothetical protein
MKVEIEKPVNDLDAMPMVMTIVSKAVTSASIETLMSKLKNEDLFRLSYGKGGNHVWVKYGNDRVLLITE